VSRKWQILLATIAVLTAIACVMYSYLPPFFRPPDHVGRVESVATDDRGRTTIRLRIADAPPADPADAGDEIRERMRQQHGIVYIHLPAGVPIRRGWFHPAEVQAGQRVRVWCEGFVMTSFPPQQNGTRLEVEAEE
jgi:Protein of unknown function (DUF3221)